MYNYIYICMYLKQIQIPMENPASFRNQWRIQPASQRKVRMFETCAPIVLRCGGRFSSILRFAARFAPKQVQVMGGDCEGPDMQSVVFGGSGGTKQKTGARYEGRMRIAQHFPHSPLITFRAQKVHVMSGECELRDIALLVFGGNCAFLHNSHRSAVAKRRAIDIRPS